MMVQIGDQQYEEIVELGRVIGLRQFDAQHQIFVELRFAHAADSEMESDLVTLLTSEYIRQQSGQS